MHRICEFTEYHDDFAGPDGLGGDLIEVRCDQPAVSVIRTHDQMSEEYMVMELAHLGGWEAYRDACKKGYEGEPYDPGPDPGVGHWGDRTWTLCELHAGWLREDVATSEALGLEILSDETLEPHG